MRKILILGGNGFIGKNLAKYMVAQGEDVYSFDITTPEQKLSDIHYIAGDFFDDYVLKKVIADMDIIFHAVCTLNPGNSNEKYIMGYERDFVQTVKLCSWLQNTKSRLIFLSSGGTVYGNQPIQPIKEDAEAVPINHYGNLKLCIENTIRTMNFQSKNNMLIARISNPYGPGQDYKKGVGFIDACIKKGMSGEDMEVWGDGEIVRDYIYIEDVCRMLYTLTNYSGLEEVFNISSMVGTSQNDVIKIIRTIFKDMNVLYTASRSVDAKKIVLDNSKIMKLDSFCLVDVETGIRRYYEYILEQGEK
ncbi:MAG: NAD-dependent epimerase/dehydratase family protein [Lachnospiraceae bacterium]